MAGHPTGPRPTVPEVSPAEARARQTAGAVVIDVREAEEWREGHVSGALHIPLASLPLRLQQLDQIREVITVCRSGNRSAFAAEALLRAGFPRVSSMTGGTLAWMEQGLPVSK